MYGKTAVIALTSTTSTHGERMGRGLELQLQNFEPSWVDSAKNGRGRVGTPWTNRQFIAGHCW